MCLGARYLYFCRCVSGSALLISVSICVLVRVARICVNVCPYVSGNWLLVCVFGNALLVFLTVSGARCSYLCPCVYESSLLVSVSMCVWERVVSMCSSVSGSAFLVYIMTLRLFSSVLKNFPFFCSSLSIACSLCPSTFFY